MKGIFTAGSLLGGILFIAGCCIGAGMLALPIVTGLCGFFPSLFLFLIAWLFMTFTALLLVEISRWLGPKVHIVSMSERLLGKWGKGLSWILYLFLFYSLLVAYIAGSGKILSSFFSEQASTYIFAALLFTVLCGIPVYLGTKMVDWINRLFMAGLIFSYVSMLAIGLPKINPSLLLPLHLRYLLLPLPVLVISFGFHNVIPTLCSYMKGDYRKVRLAILGGSLLSLVIYIFWEVLVLGLLPFDSLWENYQHGREVSLVLKSYLHTNWIVTFAQSFALFAIITSFLTQAISLLHFIEDGLKIPSGNKTLALSLATLLPPLLLALTYPNIFFAALNFAGGLCAVVLFGALPILMIWKGKALQFSSPFDRGYKRGFLALAFIFFLLILGYEIFSLLPFFKS